ncbi:MAG: RrF2 family transcriptional regulator [Microgenomates group bacterium]
MFIITREIDYSLVFLSYLVKHKGLVSLSKVNRKTKIPLRFLAKIASTLARNDLIESKEGKKGGYRIKDKVFNKVLYDYFKIFKKDLNFLPCNQKICQCKKSCQHRKKFQEKIEKKFFEMLKIIKVKEIIL